MEYINLKNAYENKELNFTKIFEDIPENIVICLNETSAPNLTSLIKNKICYNIDCSNDWIKSKKNFVNETEKCNYSCIDIYTNYIYENDIDGLIISKIKRIFLYLLIHDGAIFVNL